LIIQQPGFGKHGHLRTPDLRGRSLGGSATLAQVIAEHPLIDGLAELVGYLQLTDDGSAIVTDARERVRWTDADGRHREADLPLVLFGDEQSSPGRPLASLARAPSRHIR